MIREPKALHLAGPPLEKFAAKFGCTWSEQVEGERVVNVVGAKAAMNINDAELASLWRRAESEGRVVKLMDNLWAGEFEAPVLRGEDGGGGRKEVEGGGGEEEEEEQEEGRRGRRGGLNLISYPQFQFLLVFFVCGVGGDVHWQRWCSRGVGAVEVLTPSQRRGGVRWSSWSKTAPAK